MECEWLNQSVEEWEGDDEFQQIKTLKDGKQSCSTLYKRYITTDPAYRDRSIFQDLRKQNQTII